MESTTQTDRPGASPALPVLLTVADAATVLRCADEHVRKLIHLGLLKASRIGIGLRIRNEDLEKFLAANLADGPDPRRDPRRHGKRPTGCPRHGVAEEEQR